MSATITRVELANLLAENTAFASTKHEARKAVDAVLDTIYAALTAGNAVNLSGFGNFAINQKPARKGRNPKTGEELQISAKAVVAFKAQKSLRDAVQKLAE